MKKLTVEFIHVYRIAFSFLLKNILGVPRMCRFDITCSDYAIHSIEKYGILKGGQMSVSRLLKCQPFYKEGAY